MILCVGAASQRVVQEAALLGVHQVVASRRQVGEFAPGYTGWTSAQLVTVVHELSDGKTSVVRDHGGPYQNGDPNDDWERAFDADVDAGFDVLHLDMCKLPEDEQAAMLTRLCKRYHGRTRIEVGGERDPQPWLNKLLETALAVCQPEASVADFGGRIWADRQCGTIISRYWVEWTAAFYSHHRVKAKAHNFDWFGDRQSYGDILYNVAPEFGNVEIDAWLHVLPYAEGQQILDFAYSGGAWKRWFGSSEGTYFERARAALRYHLNSPEVTAVLNRHPDGDAYVRGVIRDALQHG